MRLNDDEVQYLKTKNITMCIDPNWMPFEKIDNGKYTGLSSDYVKYFSKQIGIPINLVKTRSWDQSLKKAQLRECDVLPLLTKTKNRLKYF